MREPGYDAGMITRILLAAGLWAMAATAQAQTTQPAMSDWVLREDAPPAMRASWSKAVQAGRERLANLETQFKTAQAEYKKTQGHQEWQRLVSLKAELQRCQAVFPVVWPKMNAATEIGTVGSHAEVEVVEVSDGIIVGHPIEEYREMPKIKTYSRSSHLLTGVVGQTGPSISHRVAPSLVIIRGYDTSSAITGQTWNVPAGALTIVSETQAYSGGRLPVWKPFDLAANVFPPAPAASPATRPATR
jgi:hypothetical protein